MSRRADGSKRAHCPGCLSPEYAHRKGAIFDKEFDYETEKDVWVCRNCRYKLRAGTYTKRIDAPTPSQEAALVRLRVRMAAWERGVIACEEASLIYGKLLVHYTWKDWYRSMKSFTIGRTGVIHEIDHKKV